MCQQVGAGVWALLTHFCLHPESLLSTWDILLLGLVIAVLLVCLKIRFEDGLTLRSNFCLNRDTVNMCFRGVRGVAEESTDL